MNRFQKLPVIVVCLLILIISVIYFILDIAGKSYNDEIIEHKSQIVKDDVRIYRDFYGIPFIEVKSNDDFYFALGYEHAYSRLWQMDFFRRTARGRLSEIFGERTVPADKFMRAFELESVADSLFRSISPKSRSILQRYSEGVNSFIDNNIKRLSFEFGALDYLPEKWEPKHSLMIGRAMAFELSLSFWIEAAYAELANKLGLEKAREFIPSYPDDAPTVLNDEISEYNKQHFEESKSDTNNGFAVFHGLAEDYRKVKELIGWKSTSTGSNSWVANRNFDPNSGAILANDPHLILALPARWILTQIKSPSINVIGFSVPGVPAILSGRNDKFAWGITNMMTDVCDFYVEQLDSSRKHYLSNNTQKKILYLKDTIKIKNSEDLIYYKQKTERSNIISELHLFDNEQSLLELTTNENRSEFFEKYAVTFEWAGKYSSDEILASHNLIHSRNFDEFKSALSSWGVPALNFTYGDKEGNIGVVPAGLIPDRQQNCDPNLPNPAWEENRNWNGISSKTLPYLYNPANKFIVSANNKLSNNTDQFISNHWEPASRSKRIEEMLAVTEKYSVRDAQIMQSDILSPYARDLCKISLPVLSDLTKIMSQQEKDAFQILNNWDYIISPVGPASVIYNSFFERLVYNVFYDELGEKIYREYCFVANVPTRRLMELMKSGNNAIFDDISTNEEENINFVIYKSFNEAVRDLRDVFETSDMTKWNWGELHILHLKHVFSENDFVSPSVSFQQLPIGGNNTTINNTEYRIFKPFEVVVGASMRFITDMNDSLVYTSIPGGISGDPVNPNYSNQVRLWLNGGYIKTVFSDTPDKGYNLKTYIFKD